MVRAKNSGGFAQSGRRDPSLHHKNSFPDGTGYRKKVVNWLQAQYQDGANQPN